MKALQILLITLTALAGCKKDTSSTTNTTTIKTADTTSMTSGKTFTYLALGDSYTIGQSVSQNDSYPYQLVGSMGQYSVTVANPTIIAATGWTTDVLIDEINNSGNTGKKFDFVTLLIGVNDQYEGQSIDNYQVKFTEVLNTAIKFANGNPNRVFVLSIPDYGVTPFAGDRGPIISPQIDQFNAVNKAASIKAGVNYVNITDISRQAAKEPDLIAGDGLHPSGIMYRMWVALLAPLVIKQLSN